MTFLEYPPSKSLSRRWNNFALNFAFPLGASIPTNGKRTADLLQSMVKSLIGHDMAQPPHCLVPPIMGRTFPLLQHVRDALHADDVFAVHRENGVVSNSVSNRGSLIAQ